MRRYIRFWTGFSISQTIKNQNLIFKINFIRNCSLVHNLVLMETQKTNPKSRNWTKKKNRELLSKPNGICMWLEDVFAIVIDSHAIVHCIQFWIHPLFVYLSPCNSIQSTSSFFSLSLIIIIKHLTTYPLKRMNASIYKGIHKHSCQ